MPTRKPAPEERAAMVQTICDYITTHGRQSFKAAHDQAEKELTPPPTPYQQRRLEEDLEWAKARRALEQEREAEQAAREAKYQRDQRILEARRQVYAAAGIIEWISSETLAKRWRGRALVRAGLHKTIRATLWAEGLARDDARFLLTDARAMPFAVGAIIAWERKRLELWSRRLELVGGRIEARSQPKVPRPVEEVRRLSAEGHGATEIAKRVGISRKAVWRITSTTGAGGGVNRAE